MSENLFGLTVAADKGLDDLQCQRLLSENRRYQEVMLQYRCALKALESRLEILNEEFSLLFLILGAFGSAVFYKTLCLIEDNTYIARLTGVSYMLRCFVLVAFAPGFTAFFRPPVLPGGGFPGACDCRAVLKEKGQHLALRHFNVIHPLKESVLVESVKPQDGRAFAFEDLLRNRTFDRASAAFLLGGTAAPELLDCSAVTPPVVHITESAVRAFDLAREAAGVRRSTCYTIRSKETA